VAVAVGDGEGDWAKAAVEKAMTIAATASRAPSTRIGFRVAGIMPRT
jgi:hypothetical protein